MSSQDNLDPRFKDLLLDPKFSTQSKKKQKVELDSRFKDVLTSEKFKQVQKVDKYGRKVKVDHGINPEMAKFYYHDEQIQQEEDTQQDDKNKKNIKKDKKPKKNKKKQESEESEQSQEQESSMEEGSFHWSKESSDEEEYPFEENEIDFWDEQHFEEENNLQMNDQSSKKLALVNYDWQNISAHDIMVLMSSLIKPPSQIKSVTVYPSQFGLDQMKIEQEKGPQQIWNQKQAQKKKPVNEQVNEWIVKNNEDSAAFDANKLRQYERDRMKYFFSVIECDSKKTAEYLYDQCDGLEFELTSMKIDLRFVDKNQEFPNKPKEVCTEIKNDGKVNNFLNRSLNHTNVKLTWDEPQMNRYDFMDQKFLENEKLQKQVDWSQYIGDISSNSEIEDEEQDLESEQEKSESSDDPFDNKRNKKIKMEIKFEQGFQELEDKINLKQKEKGLNFFERKKLRLQEKKNKRNEEKLVLKNQKKILTDPNEEGNYFNLDINKQRAQLELLTDKPKKKDDFKLDVNDPRFSAIYEKSQFHIDPTNKNYKEESSGKILQQQILKRNQLKK